MQREPLVLPQGLGAADAATPVPDLSPAGPAHAPGHAAVIADWLQSLEQLLGGTRRAAVLLQDEQGQLSVAAARPAQAAFEDARLASQQALQQQATAFTTTAEGDDLLAHPLVLDGHVRGLVLAVLPPAGRLPLDQAADLLRWGAGWLATLLVAQDQTALRQSLQRARQLNELAVAAMAAEHFDEAAIASVNSVCRLLGASQVQLGWVTGLRSRVVARSSTAWLENSSDSLRLAAAAMDEALDLRDSVVWPAPDPAPPLPAHQAYAQFNRGAALLTVPLRSQGAIVGLLLLERAQPYSSAELRVAEAMATLLGPALARQRQAGESMAAHGRRRLRQGLGRLTDTRHAAWKLGGATLVVAVLVAAVLPVPYRVTAPVEVEGEIQRAVAAPFAGFIRDAAVRAGDSVRQGQRMARLDDKDLQLERVRWQAELEMAEKKGREAMAAGNRVDLSLAAAQAAQARAQLGLALERLARTEILAPFDGVVVSGDLSQQLGSPAEQGKVLFEVAPLTAWRLMLKVDERDIDQVQVGQRGEIRLPGLPGESLPFTVKRLTSVATAQEGRNTFRVEAEVGPAAQRLRPGMEGVAKVQAGERTALWVAGHRFVDWLHITAWEWMP